MNTLRDAFLRALERLADRGLLGQAPAWVHELARRVGRDELPPAVYRNHLQTLRG